MPKHPRLMKLFQETGMIKLMRNIETFISQTHPNIDGLSSKRVLEAIDNVISGNICIQFLQVTLQDF